jgi:hypothetical protein
MNNSFQNILLPLLSVWLRSVQGFQFFKFALLQERLIVVDLNYSIDDKNFKNILFQSNRT